MILCEHLFDRKLVYADLEAIAPLEVEKMPYALQSITISVSFFSVALLL